MKKNPLIWNHVANYEKQLRFMKFHWKISVRIEHDILLFIVQLRQNECYFLTNILFKELFSLTDDCFSWFQLIANGLDLMEIEKHFGFGHDCYPYFTSFCQSWNIFYNFLITFCSVSMAYQLPYSSLSYVLEIFLAIIAKTMFINRFVSMIVDKWNGWAHSMLCYS